MISIENIIKASYLLHGVAKQTPLQYNQGLSEYYQANIYLKREDLQPVRSYKIRGAYNLIANLTAKQRNNGVVCASAGNHAQGFAQSCRILGINGTIFMPTTTPKQKIKRVEKIGLNWVNIILTGDDFDAAYAAALQDCTETNRVLVPPFAHERIIEGQGTVGLEILNEFEGKIDYLFSPVGGGGLISGVGTYLKRLSPTTKIIGVEPKGAPAMYQSLKQGNVITLESIDTFVDGAAVKRVGDINFNICKHILDDIILVPEGKICTTILNLYSDDAIVAEPAGALSVAALSQYKQQIKSKNIVCILSGGNNDIERMPEIKDRSLIYEGLKHYFIVMFPQRAGALREFLDNVLGPNDDITDFEYTKKNNRSSGPALVGIELKHPNDYQPLLERMKANNFDYIKLNENSNLYNFLI